jgi:hypothetical protein
MKGFYSKRRKFILSLSIYLFISNIRPSGPFGAKQPMNKTIQRDETGPDGCERSGSRVQAPCSSIQRVESSGVKKSDGYGLRFQLRSVTPNRFSALGFFYHPHDNKVSFPLESLQFPRFAPWTIILLVFAHSESDESSGAFLR